MSLGYDSSLTGYNYVSLYYNGETGQYDTPYYYERGYASGYNGLGWEFDSVDFGTGIYDYFGYGYYEADASFRLFASASQSADDRGSSYSFADIIESGYPGRLDSSNYTEDGSASSNNELRSEFDYVHVGAYIYNHLDNG